MNVENFRATDGTPLDTRARYPKPMEMEKLNAHKGNQQRS